MESPNVLRWRFEVGSVCTFTETKSRDVPRARHSGRISTSTPSPRSPARRLARSSGAGDHGGDHRVGDLLRAVPSIEIEHLVVLAAAVLAIGPKPKQDIGLLAGHMILEEFGRASAIEDGAVQEVAAFGFDASSCACALPARVETIAIAISHARLRAVRRSCSSRRETADNTRRPRERISPLAPKCRRPRRR